MTLQPAYEAIKDVEYREDYFTYAFLNTVCRQMKNCDHMSFYDVKCIAFVLGFRYTRRKLYVTCPEVSKGELV